MIIEKIIGDAHNKASDIIATAQSKAKDLIDNAATEREKYKATEIKKAETLAPEIIRRGLSVAELEVKKIILKAKQDVLERVFETALEEIKSLPKESYLELIEGMLQYAEDNDTVIISESDKGLVTAAFVKKVADKRGISLTLSKEYGDFRGGIILTNKGCSKNMTLELELASLRENKEARIAKMIFEEK